MANETIASTPAATIQSATRELIEVTTANSNSDGLRYVPSGEPAERHAPLMLDGFRRDMQRARGLAHCLAASCAGEDRDHARR